MKNVVKEFAFVLSDPIMFAHGGGDLEAGFNLLLKAPGNIHAKYCAKISRAFFDAASSMSAKQKQSIVSKSTEAPQESVEDSEQGAASIVMIMSVSEYFDDAFDAFRDLLCYTNPQKKGQICEIEEKTFMTKTLFDTMSLDDTNRLMGEYIQNFLIPS